MCFALSFYQAAQHYKASQSLSLRTLQVHMHATVIYGDVGWTALPQVHWGFKQVLAFLGSRLRRDLVRDRDQNCVSTGILSPPTCSCPGVFTHLNTLLVLFFLNDLFNSRQDWKWWDKILNNGASVLENCLNLSRNLTLSYRRLFNSTNNSRSFWCYPLV